MSREDVEPVKAIHPPTGTDLAGGRGLTGPWLKRWETYRMRGSDSDVDLVSGAIWTVRDGKIARIEFHADRRSALAAAGLETR
jgi:hypothetical protein